MNTPTRIRRLTVASIAAVACGSLFAGAVDASAPPADDRERLVDALLESVEITDGVGFDLERDCVSGLVAELPDSDVEIILGEYDAWMIEEAALTSGSEPSPELPVDSSPEISAEAEAMVTEIFTCVVPTADPALVDAAMAVFEAHPDEVEGLDPTCVRSILGVYPDPLLQAIIDADGETISDATLASDPELGADAMEYGFLLFVCMEPDAFGATEGDAGLALTTEAP